MSINNLEYEAKYWSQGMCLVAGVDEVGRGPLAGNVVCAAVVMPHDDLIAGVTDSKKLSEKKRNMLYDLIIDKALAYCIAEVSPRRIDEVNILVATKECMVAAINGLGILPNVVLIDAVKLDIALPQENIIKGDLVSYTIGAASILAKVYRDRQMVQMDDVYPGYNFAKHKGYGTAEHIAAIKDIGLSPIHRISFTKNFV